VNILDLFCCCGGAAIGLSDYGRNHITGVDIEPGHEYPFHYFVNDVFDLPLKYFQQFDLIWASPPCQHYSYSISQEERNQYPDLVDKTRQLLLEVGKPFIIENIPNAPLRKDLRLCGEMFRLRVLRHRIFEIHGFKVPQPKHEKHKPPIDETHSYYAQIAGHGGNSYSFSIVDWCSAIGIYHISSKEHLTQTVPPAYSNYIIRQFSV